MTPLEAMVEIEMVTAITQYPCDQCAAEGDRSNDRGSRTVFYPIPGGSKILWQRWHVLCEECFADPRVTLAMLRHGGGK